MRSLTAGALLFAFIASFSYVSAFQNIIWKGSVRDGPFFSNNAYLTFEKDNSMFLLHSPMFRIFGFYTMTSRTSFQLNGVNPTSTSFPNELRLDCSMTLSTGRLQMSCLQKKPATSTRTYYFDFVFSYPGTFSITSSFFLDDKGLAFVASSSTQKLIHAVTENYLLIFLIEAVSQTSSLCLCTGLFNGQFYSREPYDCRKEGSMNIITFPARNFQEDPFFRPLPKIANFTYGVHDDSDFTPPVKELYSRYVDPIYNIPVESNITFTGNLMVKKTVYSTEIGVYHVKPLGNAKENQLNSNINSLVRLFGISRINLPDETVIKTIAENGAFLFQRESRTSSTFIFRRLSSVLNPTFFSDNAQVDYFISDRTRVRNLPFPVVSQVSPKSVEVGKSTSIAVYLSNRAQIAAGSPSIQIFFGEFLCPITATDNFAYFCTVPIVRTAQTVNVRFVLNGIHYKTPHTFSFTSTTQAKLLAISPAASFVTDARTLYFGIENVNAISNMNIVVGNSICSTPTSVGTGIVACSVKPSPVPGPVTISAVLGTNVTAFSTLSFSYLSYYSSIRFVVLDALISPKEFPNNAETTVEVPLIITGYTTTNISSIMLIGAFFGPFKVPSNSLRPTPFRRDGLTWVSLKTPIMLGFSGLAEVTLSFTIANMGMFTGTSKIKFFDATRKLTVIDVTPDSATVSSATNVAITVRVSLSGSFFVSLVSCFIKVNGQATYPVTNILNVRSGTFDLRTTIQVSLSGSQKITADIDGCASQNAGIFNVKTPVAPVISSLIPLKINPGALSAIRLFGLNLFGRDMDKYSAAELAEGVSCGTDVALGGVPCETPKCLSNGEITCELKNSIPVTGSMSLGVAVDGNSNQEVSSRSARSSQPSFGVASDDQPAVEYIYPNNATIAGGVKISVLGSNFNNATVVMVGDEVECIIQTKTSDRIECITNAGGTPGIPVDVVVRAGTKNSLTEEHTKFEFYSIASQPFTIAILFLLLLVL